MFSSLVNLGKAMQIEKEANELRQVFKACDNTEIDLNSAKDVVELNSACAYGKDVTYSGKLDRKFFEGTKKDHNTTTTYTMEDTGIIAPRVNISKTTKLEGSSDVVTEYVCYTPIPENMPLDLQYFKKINGILHES